MRQEEGFEAQEELDSQLLDLKMEGGTHKPRHAGDLSGQGLDLS